MRLTTSQRELLERAAELQDRHGADGVYPTGSGQYRSVTLLEERGLLRFSGIGAPIDGDSGREVPIYAITDAGRAALQSVPPARPDEKGPPR